MRVLLTGASGQLGAFAIGALRAEGHDVIAWSGSEAGTRDAVAFVPIDLRDPGATATALDAADPEAVLHLAAISSAEAVRLDPATAHAVNVEATRRIAAWCAGRGRRLVFTSTDLVFDGSRPWNREDDPAGPILGYGRTKREAERAVVAFPGGVVARVSLLYGPSRCGRPYFFDRAIEAMRAGESRPFFADEFRTPLDLATAATILARLVRSDASGVVHVAGAERVSRLELMRRAAVALGIDPSLARSSLRADVAGAEPRPADVSLDTTRLAGLFPDLARPTIEEALLGR
jgi:dTDP-4-dehydrorhamnose reductase